MYLELISVEHGFDRGGSGGSSQQLLEETEMAVLGVGRSGHDLPQVLLLAEEDVGSLQESQSDLLLSQ